MTKKKEKKMTGWEIPKIIVGLCEDCAFYNDCPAEYLCPCAELVVDATIHMINKEGKE